MPNTEVKLSGAENTWVATPREDREMPALSFYVNDILTKPGVLINIYSVKYSSSSQCVAFAGLPERQMLSFVIEARRR